MGKEIIPIRTVAAVGIGTVLFFVLMRFVTIPSGIPDTSLNLSAAIVTVFAAIFGPITGFLISFIGHTLADLIVGKIWWSWVIADAAYGLLIGLFWKVYKIEEGGFGIKKAVVFNVIQILANMAAWLAIAPTLDGLFYVQKVEHMYLQGLTAGGLNSMVVLILGTILAVGYSRTRKGWRRKTR
jgi:energy-coupling factor transport system substrate-specific component